MRGMQCRNSDNVRDSCQSQPMLRRYEMICHRSSLIRLYIVSFHTRLWLFFTSTEEGGYVFSSVCLYVCLSVCLFVCPFVCLSVGLLANLWTDFDEIFWRGMAWLKDQVIQFWWRSGSRFRSGSPKSEIRVLRIGGCLCSLSIAFLFVTWTSVTLHHM